MDKKGNIHEHSKIKLELYRLYLELYLSVLLTSQSFKTIDIHDIFAGMGKSTDNEKGSALLAAIEIQKMRPRFPNTHVALRLNEKDPNNFSCLEDVLKPFSQFTALFNQDANDYISTWSSPPGSHNLFFIDPHGYTQVTTDNLKRLFTMKNSDFLIFIPIYHIYRFLKPSTTEGQDDEDEDYGFFDDLGIETSQKRTVDRNTYYTPIATFLSGLGINQADAENTQNLDEFTDLIVGALKEISGSDFVYSHMIKKKNKNSKYCLFFISHHILGAEKFLDARSQLITKIDQADQQQAFDFVSDISQKSTILDFVEQDHIYDNLTIYEVGIKSGFKPSELNKEIRDIEKNDSQRIEITPITGKQRNKKGLYLGYTHYKDNNRVIHIKFKNLAL